MMKTVELAYKVYGEQHEGLPLFVLHGLLGSKENWHTVASKLSESMTVIAVDLRNHGDSAHDDAMSYTLMAADVQALARDLGYERFRLMGHSMGGKVAMALALSAPEVLSQLLVVDIAPKAYSLIHHDLLKGLLLMPVETLKSRKQADTFLADYMSDPFERAFILKNLQRVEGGGFAWRCHLRGIARQYLKIAAFPAGRAVESLPCVFIRGALSDYIVDGDLALIEGCFPSFSLETISGAGHMPHVEKPLEFLSVLDRVLL